MPFLVAGLVLVGLMAAVNLALVVLVLRRWQQAPPVDPAPPANALPAPGDHLPAVTAATAEGTTLTGADLTGRHTLIGFFSGDCAACLDALPLAAEAARGVRASGGIFAAFVAAGGDHGDELAQRLAALADVLVVQPAPAPAAAAFGVRRFPAFVRSGPDGTVLRSGSARHVLAAERAAAAV